MAALHIIVKGKVQGVFFRATAKKVADKLGVAGKVRNMDEGHVEIWASGTDEQLESFVEWCREGPAGAKVSNVQTEPLQEKYEEFIIVRS